MPRYDFRTPRLFVEAPLTAGASVALDPGQSNYLLNVLRRGPDDPILVFNGRDGEWCASVAARAKKRAALTIGEQTRTQPAPGDLHYWFAPLKHARLDYMVQKAVEMGASRLHPVLTRYTQAERVNTRRMRANAIEAAEQCGILAVPEISEPARLTDALAGLAAERLLVFCDEEADVKDPVAALAAARSEGQVGLTVLIGPEGGIAEDERAAILAHAQRDGRVVRLALGPRILRADTAAVAALALVGAVLGDWR